MYAVENLTRLFSGVFRSLVMKVMDLRSSYYFGISVLFVLLLLGLEARDNGCDPEFKATVEECLRRVQGFPVLAMNKTFLSGDWSKTDIICKRGLARSASECVRQEYARCPQTQAWRSLCGYQDLNPDVLIAYGEAVCKHREVLEQHWGCQKSGHCSLQSCLNSYTSSIPSAMTVGMWKHPLYSPFCSYHAYTEYCHEKNVVPECPAGFYVAHRDIITSSRPFSCSMEDIQRLKRRYRENEINLAARNNAASVWSHDAVSRNLIGCSVLGVVIAGAWRRVVGLGE